MNGQRPDADELVRRYPWLTLIICALYFYALYRLHVWAGDDLLLNAVTLLPLGALILGVVALIDIRAGHRPFRDLIRWFAQALHLTARPGRHD